MVDSFHDKASVASSPLPFLHRYSSDCSAPPSTGKCAQARSLPLRVRDLASAV